LSYIWEDEIPAVEATTAYIKRGMTYLKQEGKMIICFERIWDALIEELNKSKKYIYEIKENYIVVRRKLDKLFT
jgi:hypothetical protein